MEVEGGVFFSFFVNLFFVLVLVVLVLVVVVLVIAVLVFLVGVLEGLEEFAVEFVAGDFVVGCEGALDGVKGDVLNDFVGAELGCVLEVLAGDLEGVEEQACAAGVEGVFSETFHDLADGVLDGAAVFGQREGDRALVGRVVIGVVELGRGLGAAGGVVVVAEVLVAETGRAAAATVGEDVAALVAAVGDGGFGHETPRVRGSWFVVRGSWFVVRGSWSVVEG